MLLMLVSVAAACASLFTLLQRSLVKEHSRGHVLGEADSNGPESDALFCCQNPYHSCGPAHNTPAVQQTDCSNTCLVSGICPESDEQMHG